MIPIIKPMKHAMVIWMSWKSTNSGVSTKVIQNRAHTTPAQAAPALPFDRPKPMILT